MACKNARKNKTQIIEQQQPKAAELKTTEVKAESSVERLLFGVDSEVQVTDLLQNNITEFEWAVRNKIYPNFWGRNIVGENSLTKEEIEFLHDKGCKIAAIYKTAQNKKTLEEGKLDGMKVDVIALELGIPEGSVIFLEIKEDETVKRDYMLGFAKSLISNGYTPGFKANTDAKFTFDREFSRGMQTDREIFKQCLVWATSPSLAEYERVTTTHLIHPDNWVPYAPSGITRADIAIWQYGRECHPIHDDAGKETSFNVNLVRNEQVIIDKMF